VLGGFAGPWRAASAAARCALIGVLKRLARVRLCLVGAALALDDGDLGLADSVRDGGRGVLEALDEAELGLEHVARLVGDGDVEAGEVDTDPCARVLWL